VWCANIGHSNERIVQLLNRQVKESVHHGYRFRNEQAEKLSVKLQQLTGLRNGASVFLSSGSEAVNLSITLARYLTGRKKVLKIDNSYLSAYGFARISDENTDLVTVKYNHLDAVKKIDFSEIAAFLVETGGASIEMVRFPDFNFIKALIGNSKINDCLVIAEEVTTGMGRTGKWFGYQYYGLTPDMVVTGKGLGNGYPVSAVTISSALNEQFSRHPFRYAQSHQNDPLGCAIGLEVINYIEENGLIEKGNKTGEYFKTRLEQIAENHPGKVKEVRARGLMLALEFTGHVDGEAINNQLFESGFITGFKQNTLRFLPPLIITENDIEKLIGRLDELLGE
jgi:acetylornithine aminotransferase